MWYTYLDNFGIHEDLRMIDFRTPTIKQVSILYSVSVILLMFLATRAQRNEIYSGLIITEVLLVLPMPLLLLFIFKYDMKKVLRLNKISGLNLLLIFGIMVFVYFPVNFLNQYYMLLIKIIFGHVTATSVTPAKSIIGLIVDILIIGVSAGVCEEVLFRGTIMRGFERFGARWAIVITGFLFGLWHMYFTSLFFAFTLGILLGYIAYRTNSLFGSMFAHFFNNTISVVIGFLTYKITKGAEIVDIDKTFTNLLNGPTDKLVAYFVSTIFLTLASSAVLVGLLIAFNATTAGIAPKIYRENNSNEHRSISWLIPGFLFIGFTYVALGLSLLKIKNPIIHTIGKFIGIS